MAGDVTPGVAVYGNPFEAIGRSRCLRWLEDGQPLISRCFVHPIFDKIGHHGWLGKCRCIAKV